MTEPRAKAPAPRFKKYDSLEQVSKETQEIYRQFQRKTHRIFSSAPILTDLKEGEIVFYDNESTTRRLYTKLNGALRYVALT